MFNTLVNTIAFFDMVTLMAAEVVVPSTDFDGALQFLLNNGFRIDEIFPADDPATARMSGHGIALRLVRATEAQPIKFHIEPADRSAVVQGPGGLEISYVHNAKDLDLGPLESTFVFSPASTADNWVIGRAGMHYRDLIPDRQGGRFIASHIRIVEGGPVPDYVHHHHIRFQMIYCYKGWVDVVYEDQGPPFRLERGDCVLQPPHIRHRVLESSAGCEVIEIGCPAVHETLVDHELSLPTEIYDPNRLFGGQTFVRFEQDKPSWQDHPQMPGWLYKDTGIAEATSSDAGVSVLRPANDPGAEGGGVALECSAHGLELLFHFVLDGQASLVVDGTERSVDAGDAFVIPPGNDWSLKDGNPSLRLLRVQLPG